MQKHEEEEKISLSITILELNGLKLVSGKYNLNPDESARSKTALSLVK